MNDTIDLLQLCAFNAAYAHALDSDALDEWPAFFTEDCTYCIKLASDRNEATPDGGISADSRAMLQERIAAFRAADGAGAGRRRYRHILGIPLVESASKDGAEARTPFLVAATAAGGETVLVAAGEYEDRFVVEGGKLLLAERLAVVDGTEPDALAGFPL